MGTASWGNYLGGWYNYLMGIPEISGPQMATPGASQKTQKELDDLWAVIKEMKKPYPQGTQSDDDFNKSFGNAWNYLWEEARQVQEVLTPEDTEMLKQIFSKPIDKCMEWESGTV